MRGNKFINLLGSPGSAVPSWVLSGAAVDIDFSNNRAFGGSFASLLSITRASSATDLLPSSASGYAYNTYGNNVLVISPNVGLLIFEARTNLLLNSTAPATQTTASLGTGTYTLWVNGSGSALASGGTATITGASPATNGAPNTITVTVAGTVTITVTGSLNFFQLEAGAFGTSGIITAGATAARAADIVQSTGALLAATAGTSMSLITQTNFLPGTVNTRLYAFAGGQTPLAINSSVSLLTFDGSVVQTATLGGGTYAGSVKSGFATDNVTMSLVGNNGTVKTATDTFVRSGGFVGSNSAISNFLNGPMQRITAWNTRISDAALKSFTQ